MLKYAHREAKAIERVRINPIETFMMKYCGHKEEVGENCQRESTGGYRELAVIRTGIQLLFMQNSRPSEGLSKQFTMRGAFRGCGGVPVSEMACEGLS